MTPVNLGAAVITGASSGIGEAFARHLAARGHSLVLVARRSERLALLAGELTRQHSVQVEVIKADLSDMMDIERVEKRLAEHPCVDLLVNNAGFGTSAAFAASDALVHQAMINVHVGACVRFASAVLPGMISRRRGAIITVSSLAAFFPRPRRVMYCATKAFLVTFARALSSEVANHGIRVLVLCPGFTRTEFHSSLDEEGRAMAAKLPRIFWMSPGEVVDHSLKALGGRSPVYIPGVVNHILFFAAQSRIGRAIARCAMRLLYARGNGLIL